MNDRIGSIVRDTYRGGTEIAVYTTVAHDDRAKLAAGFVEHWGMVAGIHDGEDSSGRSKVRLATVDEVVERACAMAELLTKTFDERGWTITIPAPQPEEKPVAK